MAEAEASGKLCSCRLQLRLAGASPGPQLMGIGGPVHTVVYSWVGISRRRLSLSQRIKVLALESDLYVVMKPLAQQRAPQWVAGEGPSPGLSQAGAACPTGKAGSVIPHWL